MPGPSFWDDRYARNDCTYGRKPNAFVAAEARGRLPAGAEVLDLGAGEGRNAVHLAREGYRVTAVDASAVGLEKARDWARGEGLAIDLVQADVQAWAPGRTWDAAVVTFLHLDPKGRRDLYALIRSALRPGGVLLAEWFRPEQITEGHESGGPPRVDQMVTADELRRHFPEAGIELLADAQPVLDEGEHHRGPAATVRLVWRRPGPEASGAQAQA
jgi:SAM-dependent methyltransferase